MLFVFVIGKEKKGWLLNHTHTKMLVFSPHTHYLFDSFLHLAQHTHSYGYTHTHCAFAKQVSQKKRVIM